MKFLFGVAVGAAGLWAYRTGKLHEWMGMAPEPMRQTFNAAVERVGQAANTDQVREFASTVQDRVRGPQNSPIATPSASEVSGRPSDPLPS